MNQLTKKINNHLPKKNIDFASKNTLKKKIIPSEELFIVNPMNIRINKILNNQENFVYVLNQKVANGRSFEKKLKDKQNLFKDLIKKEKKEINSFEMESRDEISTNNLTEIFHNNSNINTPEIKNNYVKMLNIKINNKKSKVNQNAKISTSEFAKYINSNDKKFISNLHIKDYLYTNFHQKKEHVKHNSKHFQEMKHIKVNKKNKKKCLLINPINIIKKSLNLNLNNNNGNNKKNETKRKYSNLTENVQYTIGIDGIIPQKSKTQNYMNLNINNFHSNQKLSRTYKFFPELNSKSLENNKINNNLTNSKKKLFVENNDNNNSNITKNKNPNQDNKKMTGIYHINLNKNNNYDLNIPSAQKFLKSTSPKNKSINYFQKNNQDKNINNNIFKKFGDNNYNINKKSEKNKDICYTDRINIKGDEKELNQIQDKNNNTNIKKDNSIKKKIFLLKKKVARKSIINKNCVKNIQNKEKEINLNKDNIVVYKNKKSSHNNTSNANTSGKKKLKLELNLEEKNTHKYIHYDAPIINRVNIFEIGNHKISKNYNLSTSNNEDTNNNKNKKTLLNLILNESDKKKEKENKNDNEAIELTPKKKINIIVSNNINFKNKKKQENNSKENIHWESSATPIEYQNIKQKETDFSTNVNNNDNCDFNLAHNPIKTKNSRNNLNNGEKEFCEMQTPVLLNTTKLTERILDAKINLFEKIKNIKTNSHFDQNKNKINDSSDNSDIIYKEFSVSAKNNKKIRIKNSIKYIIFLDKTCIEKIFDYLDIKQINILCTVNKRCFNIFKPIINKIIKEKIMLYYNLYPSKYINKIKLSILNFSPLSKLSPLLFHKKYIDLLLEKNQKYDKEIQKDLTRTFPNNSSFKYGNSNYNKLYHLLTVYSLYNEKIGYAQGINFIAANIILLMEKEKEETCLMFLDGLLRKFDFGELSGLSIGDWLKKNLNILNNYLEKFSPEIMKFLENSKLSHEFFSTNWMLTLFTNSMDIQYLFVVWDFLIIFGWKFFMCFNVSVLNMFKDDILNQEQNKLTFFMKNIFRNQKFIYKFHQIVDNTFDLMNKEYKYNGK